MSVIDFVAIMPYYIGLTMSDDNEVGSCEHHHCQLYHHPSSRHHRHHHHNNDDDHHHHQLITFYGQQFTNLFHHTLCVKYIICVKIHYL